MKRIISIAVAIILSLGCVVYAFSDIDANDKTLNEAVDLMTKFGILNGYEDGTFRPNNEITRAEFSKVIIETIMTDEEVSGDEAKFIDVKENHWAKGYIYLSRKLGIVNGMTIDTFAPENNITYEQAVKMIVAALGYDKQASENGGWPTGYLAVAKDLDITKGISFNPTANATRGDVVLMLNNALNIEYYILTPVEDIIETNLSDLTLYERHMNAIKSDNTTPIPTEPTGDVQTEQGENSAEDPNKKEESKDEVKSDAEFTLTDENGEYDNADLIDESYAEDEEMEFPTQNSGELTNEEDASDYEYIPDDPSYIG